MGMLVDLVNDVKSVNVVRPQSVTATGTVVPTSTDFENCEVSTGAIVDVGAVSGTTPSVSVQIEESDDQSTWTAIAGLVFSGITTSNQHLVQRGLRQKQYVRANVTTISGTATPTFTMSVEVISQNKYAASSGNQGGYSRSPST